MKFQICTRCVMDTTDPNITFNPSGVCSYCQFYDARYKLYVPAADIAKPKLEKQIALIKKAGQGKEYDCIAGMSGGVDSTYLLLKIKEFGLRPLVVHVDAGWNSELAVKNIENTVQKLGFDLFTIVIDWQEMRDLQLAFLKASVPNQDIPQDHAFFASLYNLAIQHNIQHVLTGSNYSTESVLPKAWGHTASDATHIKYIHKLFGNKKNLKKYPTLGLFRHEVLQKRIKKMQVFAPLDLMDYKKDAAKNELISKLEWRDYGGKHCESRFTKFFQSYYLPKKFNFDKRKAHLASLIISNQMTREEALEELNRPAMQAEEVPREMDYIARKLEISVSELEKLMALPNKAHTDYKTDIKIRSFLYSYGLKAKLKSLVT